MKIVMSVLSLILMGAVAFAAENTPQQFEGFNLQGYTESGQKAWDVLGDSADVQPDKIDIVNVNANRYGEPNVNLKAKNGTLNKVSGDVHLEKDVVITTETGEKLTTDTLDWQKTSDLVSTEDFVVITGKDGMRATGTGLKAQPSLKIAKLEKDVTVKVDTQPKTPSPENVLVVTCDGPMEIDQNKNMGVFQNNVVAVQTGRQLKADKMEIYFNPETKQVQQVICIGNVEISQGENKSFSDRAIYNAADQKVVLTGRPKLIMVTEGPGSISTMNKMNKGQTSEEPVSSSASAESGTSK